MQETLTGAIGKVASALAPHTCPLRGGFPTYESITLKHHTLSEVLRSIQHAPEGKVRPVDHCHHDTVQRTLPRAIGKEASALSPQTRPLRGGSHLEVKTLTHHTIFQVLRSIQNAPE